MTIALNPLPDALEALRDAAIEPPAAAARRGPEYSVVVPFFNESACAGTLLAEITDVMRRLRAPYEVILVDDGSTDTTQAVLRSYAEQHRECRLLHLDSNRGQAAALYAGLKVASAPIV